MTSRAELERCVDELARQHAGREFADSVRAYSESLDADGQAELKRILLERAAGFDEALMDRVDGRGWLRRQWDRASAPPRNR